VVAVKPLPGDVARDAAGIARHSIDKQYHGEIQAQSAGQMLSTETGVAGSAAYVAIEWVTGAVHGRRGTFALQHSGTLHRGIAALSVTVLPDSGTGELTGLRGRMEILIDGGRHSYAFEYELG
jgi:hypothetical protein